MASTSSTTVEPRQAPVIAVWADLLVKTCLAHGTFLPEFARGSKLVIIACGKPTVFNVERVEIASRSLALIDGSQVRFFPLEPETPFKVAATPLRQLIVSYGSDTLEFQLTNSYDELEERFGKMVLGMYPDLDTDRANILQICTTRIANIFNNVERLIQFALNVKVYFPNRQGAKFALVEGATIVSRFLQLQIVFFGTEAVETVYFPTTPDGRKVELTKARQLIISQKIGDEEIQLNMLAEHFIRYYGV